MLNKQSFYHYVDGVMFTCTKPLTKEEFIEALEIGLQLYGLVKGSVDIDDAESGYKEPEAGNSDDLI